MRVHSSTRFAAMAVLVGALACAGNTARDADMDETAAARDTTTDTLGQNDPGYRGMERDTTLAPDQEATDSFLLNQGTGQAQDTTGGYGELDRADTTGQQGQDTTGWGGQTDTTGWQGGQQDTTGMQGQTDTAGGAWGADTSGALPTGDTTGYDQSQQQNQSDTTTSR